jgi:putative addiction module killer protein
MTTPVQKKPAKRTLAYRTWYDAVADKIAKTMVAARVERVQMGLYGDVKPVGKGVSELRIDHGPGYRVYFTEALDDSIVLLLLGGDKASQKKDVEDAKAMLMNLKKERDAKKKAGTENQKARSNVKRKSQ